MTGLTFAKALGAGLRAALMADERVMLLGEDIGRLGGVFRVTDGLQAEFGADRVLDTPLAESAIVGAAIGLAYRGYRPVCEIQFDGFVYPAFDQIVSQLAKMHARTGGRVRMPVTIRIPVGGGIGAAEHHSESPEAYFAHTAGLRVVCPSTPQDAATMLRQAIACDDPVVFFEPKRRYHVRGEVDADLDLAGVEPLGAARMVRTGSDVTIIAFGALVATALDAASAAADEGIDADVIDLRSISPVDWPAVVGSVRRTGRVVVAAEGPREAGLAAELAAGIAERCFAHLAHAPVRITGHDVPYPPAKAEGHQVPDLDRILFGVDTALGRVPARLEVTP